MVDGQAGMERDGKGWEGKTGLLEDGTALRWSPKETTAISGGRDESVDLWDAAGACHLTSDTMFLLQFGPHSSITQTAWYYKGAGPGL